MTYAQVKALTDEEIRIKVAELLGWVSNGAGAWHKDGAVRKLVFEDGEGRFRDTHPLPNYPRDLNACHEFEKTLADGQWTLYTDMLTPVDTHYVQRRHCAHATARQRCEAFIIAKEEVQ